MSESKVTLVRRVSELEQQLLAAQKFRFGLDAAAAAILAVSAFGAGCLTMIAYGAGGAG